MKTRAHCFCGLLAVLLLCIAPAAAYPLLPAGNPDTGNRPAGIVEYGSGKDFGLVKVTQVHYARPAETTSAAKSPDCFRLSGWKWTGPVTYTISPDPDPVPALKDGVRCATEQWDGYTSARLFTVPADGTFPFGSRDGVNSVSYGDYPDRGVIAVTATWYIPSAMTAVESDILFDTGYRWGTTGDPELLDIRSIATHEIGHTLGLSDEFTAPCSAMTMFGFSDYGETKKRSLDSADVAGLCRLYGP